MTDDERFSDNNSMQDTADDKFETKEVTDRSEFAYHSDPEEPTVSVDQEKLTEAIEQQGTTEGTVQNNAYFGTENRTSDNNTSENNAAQYDNSYDRYKPGNTSTGYSYYNIGEQHSGSQTGRQNGYENNTQGYGQAAQNSGYDASAPKYDEKTGKKLKIKKPKKVKKERTSSASFGKKLGMVAAFAAVAGLIAGSVFYAVNAIGNKMIYDTTKTAQTTQTSTDRDTTVKNVTDTIDEAIKEENEESTVSSSDSDTDTDSEGNMTVAQVAKECMPAVVTIATISVMEMQSFFGGSQKYEAAGAGTGVIVGQNDTELLIATNNHVVEDATSLSVGFVDETSVEAYIKGTDEDNDLAVIAVKLTDISDDTISQIGIVDIGDSDELQLGDQVVAIGNALGYGQSVTSGYVSAKGRTLTLNDGTETFQSTDLIQVDAAINAGNSGGALLNMKGQLVGINEAKGSSSSSSSASVEGMGYAISIDKALPILNELMSTPTRTPVDEDKMGYLGITCADVTSEIASSYNMPEGICITEVISGGPCEQAGLIKGDVITAFDGTEVSTYDELKEELQYYEAGTTVTITYMRADNGTYVEQEASVVLTTADILENYQSGTDNSTDSQNNNQDNSANGQNNNQDNNANGQNNSQNGYENNNSGNDIFNMFN